MTETLDAIWDTGLFNLKLQLLDNVVEDLDQFGRLEWLNSSAVEDLTFKLFGPNGQHRSGGTGHRKRL